MKNTHKGFTLLEMMVAISIFSLILGYLTIYFTNEIRLFYSKDNDIELKEDARIALDRIVNKIRQTNGLTFSEGPDGTGIIYKDSEVYINTSKNDPQGDINYSFDESTGIGAIKDSSGNKITGNIKSFVMTREDFPNTDDELIKITLTVGSSRSSVTRQYSTAVRLFSLSNL